MIGIWTGIPDGTPMNGVSARNLVVPLLQKLLTVLPKTTVTNGLTLSSPTLSLKKLSSSNEQQKVHKTLPTLLFPIDDTAIELEKMADHYKPMPLNVTGGKRPYTWLIDGKPLPATWQQKQFWTPSKAGYYTIAVVDANGKVDRANIEIK